MNSITNWFSRLFGPGTPAAPTILPGDGGDASMDRNGRPLERLPEAPNDDSNPELQHLVSRINSGSRRAYIPENSADVAGPQPTSGQPWEPDVFHESALVQRHPWASPADDSPTSVLSEATHFAHHEVPARRPSLESGWDEEEEAPATQADNLPELGASPREDWEAAEEQPEPGPWAPTVADESSYSHPLSDLQQLSSYDEEEAQVERQAEPEGGPVNHYTPAQREWERGEDDWVYPPEAPRATEEAYPATRWNYAPHPGEQEAVTASTSPDEEWEPPQEEWVPIPPQQESRYRASIVEHEPDEAEALYEDSSRHWYKEPAGGVSSIPSEEPTSPEPAPVTEYSGYDLEPAATTSELFREYPAAAEEPSLEEPLAEEENGKAPILEEAPVTLAAEPERMHYTDESEELSSEIETEIEEAPEAETQASSNWKTHSRPDELEVGQSTSLSPAELEMVSEVNSAGTLEPEAIPETVEAQPGELAVHQYSASFANLPDPYTDPVGARPGRLDRNPPPPPRGRQLHSEEEPSATTQEPAFMAPAHAAPVEAAQTDVAPADEAHSGSPLQTGTPPAARSADSMFFPPATRSQRLARRAAEGQATAPPPSEASEPTHAGPPRLSRRWALLSQFGPVNGDPVVTDPSPTQRRSHYKIVDTNQPSDE